MPIRGEVERAAQPAIAEVHRIAARVVERLRDAPATRACRPARGRRRAACADRDRAAGPPRGCDRPTPPRRGSTIAAALRTPAAGCSAPSIAAARPLARRARHRAEAVQRPQRVQRAAVDANLVDRSVCARARRAAARRRAGRARRADAARAAARACCRTPSAASSPSGALFDSDQLRRRLRVACHDDAIDAPAQCDRASTSRRRCRRRCCDRAASDCAG